MSPRLPPRPSQLQTSYKILQESLLDASSTLPAPPLNPLWTETLHNRLSSQRDLNWRQLSTETRCSNGAPGRGWESRPKQRPITGPLPDRAPKASAGRRVAGRLSTRRRPPGAGPRRLRYVSGGGRRPGEQARCPCRCARPALGARRPCSPERYATAPGPAMAPTAHPGRPVWVSLHLGEHQVPAFVLLLPVGSRHGGAAGAPGSAPSREARAQVCACGGCGAAALRPSRGPRLEGGPRRELRSRHGVCARSPLRTGRARWANARLRSAPGRARAVVCV